MTPRSRARWTRAAVLIALIGGTFAVSATAAAGAPAPISILSVSAENVAPGDKVQVQFRVTNNGTGADTAIVVVGGGLPCATGCRAEPNLKPGQSQDFQATVVAPEVNAGETLGVNISVAVRLGGQNSYDFKMVYIHGAGAGATQPEPDRPSPEADQPSSEVDGVSGWVRDTGGNAIGGVALTVQDSAGHEYRTTSDQSGRFSIQSSPGKPIAEGQITVDAALDGYRATRTTVQGSAGDTASVELTLAAVAVPTETRSSPTATTAAAETPESKISTAAAASADLEAGGDEGSGPLPFILGGVLVAAGLGALALIVQRRRNAAPAGAGMSDAPTEVLYLRPTADGNQQRGDDPHGGPGL
ncbi:MAG: carboxypeptidase regulatory-like domain-containing protein [Saccharothrix sp.]|nr:carboxypeptidase regulatory-like domain-containing protein [Saccharothrix sp.]